MEAGASVRPSAPARSGEGSARGLSASAGLLCGRTYTSTLLVQNISRWAAAPPALIAHLLKQEIVRRSPSLKLLLQRHPNAPTEPRR